MVGTITICNKLNKRDSATGLEVWYKTIIPNVKYRKNKIATMIDTNATMGELFTILIPFSGSYKQYDDWKDSVTKELYYTMSQGDYIFFGELTEEVTPTSIVKLKSSKDCCEVRSVEEVVKKYGVKIQLRVGGV